MTQTDEITVHHQGAGNADGTFEFLNEADYSVAVGGGRYEIRRSPLSSFTTTGKTKKTLQVCFSGNRMIHELTDDDIEQFRSAVNECRERDYITEFPYLGLHGDNGLSACPGTKVKERRDELVVASQAIRRSEPAPIDIEEDYYMALSVADSQRPGNPAGRTRVAKLFRGHGVAMVNDAHVVDNLGNREVNAGQYGVWYGAGANWVKIAQELVDLNDGTFIVLLDDNGTIGPVRFVD